MKKAILFVAVAIMLVSTLVPAYAADEARIPTAGIGPVGYWHITANNVCLRVSASSTGTVLGLVQYGNEFKNYGIYNDVWRKVHMTTGSNMGKDGYVHKDYTKLGIAI